MKNLETPFYLVSIHTNVILNVLESGGYKTKAVRLFEDYSTYTWC